jgi:hypothetical protein
MISEIRIVIPVVIPVTHHSSSHLQAEASVKKMELCSSGNDPVSEADCKMSNGSEGVCVKKCGVCVHSPFKVLHLSCGSLL